MVGCSTFLASCELPYCLFTSWTHVHVILQYFLRHAKHGKQLTLKFNLVGTWLASYANHFCLFKNS